jgi:Na+-translocating ferredoxin:NAD+ oxidoreductase RnfD subunit
MLKPASIKTQLILFLIAFGLYVSFLDKNLWFFRAATLTVITALAADTFFAYLKDHKFIITDSSAISGLIIALVLASDNKWWILASASLFAICSKNLIRFNRRQVFNPAAFGIFLSIILFGTVTEWKGAYLWYLLVPFGFYFVNKIKRLEVLSGYLLVTFVLFGVQAFVQKQSLIYVFGYLSYFYIFIMLIEPKTTPARPLAKFIFGALAAAIIFILSEIGVTFDAELAALLIANVSVILLNRLIGRHKSVALKLERLS